MQCQRMSETIRRSVDSVAFYLFFVFWLFGILFGQATIVVVASPRKPWEVCLDSFYNRHLFFYLYTTFL